MLGTVKEKIIESTAVNEDILVLLTEGRDFKPSAVEIKPDAQCSIAVNGNEFSVDKDEVLSFPYNFMEITSIIALTAGVKLKIRYLDE